MKTINQARLAEVATLSKGDHNSIEDGMCVMEAVAYVAGEPWSDAPACAGDALKPTTERLQDGAVDLVRRMVEVRS